MNFPQRCKVCGRVDRWNFQVDDKTWGAIVPNEFKDCVVCLPCFDYFASAKNIAYDLDREIHFVGEKSIFKARIISKSDAYPV